MPALLFVTRKLDLLTAKQMGFYFPGLVEHLYVEFGDPSCIGYYRATLY